MSKTVISAEDEKREKNTVLEFFKFVTAGKPKDARHLFAPKCVYHNPYAPEGMDALLESMSKVQQSGQMGPSDIRFHIKHVLTDGNLVVVYTTVESKSDASKGPRQIHLFRLQCAKIAEYWDVTQVAPADAPYVDRMY
jgi:predicted SnoaL-like aldol condensation-catalyzing enzyme